MPDPLRYRKLRPPPRICQPMKTKKTEIDFDPDALLARVEGFAAGSEPARERTVKLPPSVKPPAFRRANGPRHASPG